MAFPKKHRIISKNIFERIFSQGKTVQNSFFFVYYLKNNLTVSRFAVIVSVKVSNKAVIRNKIRRIVSANIQKLLPKLLPGLDVIIVAKYKVKDQKFLQLGGSLIEIFEKAKIL